ncbi:TonB-dependent receptor plug domain-containing protein [Opitutus sp. ER46]|uniref:TonB-dependent receptor plug domain-containing protein n=1 Tax=Opitutus sp. ER46 TaxID=2161864 RepID=UPI000D30851B|nr:TonB-dependent receptor plug domain-containing protein [Opitutus sp. ER46]PTX91661.1 TonB-dependent receptor [Opitutus sp. ER46]
MKIHSKPFVLALVAAATCQWVLAQSAPKPPEPAMQATGADVTPTNPATKAAADDEIMTLTPFEVTAAKDTGYQATETLAGTRIRTNLRDVGAALSVITKEFLQDIGATDSTTLLQYTTNAEVAGTRGTYAGLGNGTSVDETGNLRSPGSAQRVRGLAAADNARDFYITDIPWDSFNVDRIDILRGPNSILYGLGSPAGIVNGSTRNAEFRNRGQVDARVASYGSVRTNIDINQQLIKNVLAIRLDGLWDHEKFQQKPAFENDERIYGALRFDPQLFKNRSLRTSIKMKYEHGDIDANRPRIIPPNDSLTPWWRPVAVTADNPFGGMAKTLVNNPYDVWRTDNVVAGDGRGLVQSSSANYLPWLSDFPNQQQPYYLIDGGTNQLYRVDGGYINTFARNSSGGFTGVSNGIPNKRQNGMFYGLGNLSNVANATGRVLPGAQYGQYRNQSLLDPTVFDFYNNLIDGPTKWEMEKWDAYNIDFSQTAFDDRLGVQLSYDRQKYYRAGEAFLGGSPTLTIDILKNFSDFYTKGLNGTTSVQNQNLGRPYVTGANNNGGNSYSSDRKYMRGSVFAEFRAADVLSNSFLVKLLGKHRFNGVASDEKFFNESRTWQMYANSQAWAGYWNGNDGSTSDIRDRSPMAFVYLGGPIHTRSSASGANIPRITTNITMPDTGVYAMDATWQNWAVGFADPWNVPESLYRVYNGLPNAESTTQLTQASNPANMVGWNSNFQNNLVRYNRGQDLSLVTGAQKSLRQTTSYSGSYQGYFWNNAFVATLGWRYDQVKTKDVTAQQMPGNRGIRNLSPDVYKLPDVYPANQILKGHSTSGGAVLHLNQVLPRDPLPFNVSLSYNESSNFQVTSVRRDVYGTPIANPSGKTYEYGVLLSTKDNKYSFRGVKYTTRVTNASSGLSDAYVIGQIITNGLNWRNVFLYQLGGYDFPSRGQDSYRNRWTNAYPDLSEADALKEMNASITGWNNIQKWLAGRGFFKAWNFNPLGPDTALVDRSTYLSNPTQYAPDPLTVYSYASTQPQGFTVTADTESTGYEAEFTANPLPNWRVSFNASQTEATRNNVGGAALTEFINYLDTQLYSAPGVLSPAGKIPRWGGAGAAVGPNVYAPWRSKYVLMKLQEGTAAPEIREYRYNFVTNYSFRRGFLKGVGVGGAYRWQDKVVIGYPVKEDGNFDLSKPYYGPSEDGIDLWASYERKLTDKVNWKIQLNVRNAFAKDGLIPISIEPDGKTWASVRVKPTQEWFLTNTFSF